MELKSHEKFINEDENQHSHTHTHKNTKPNVSIGLWEVIRFERCARHSELHTVTSVNFHQLLLIQWNCDKLLIFDKLGDIPWSSQSFKFEFEGVCVCVCVVNTCDAHTNSNGFSS